MFKFPRVVRNYSSFFSDFEPHSVVKVISRTGSHVQRPKTVKDTSDKDEKKENEIEIGCNEVGIQMISENLSRQIFGHCKKPTFQSEVIEK
jgi:hypothetical protein